MAKQKTDPITRFHKKYIVNEETGCWEWQDKLMFGYGRLQINGKMMRAHRFSYEYFIGALDSNLDICHKCNNPSCVNPEHLRQDTTLSNVIDCIYAKRRYKQILSVEEVIQIKKELQHYYRGQCKDLAHFYKVSQETISAIKSGRSWTHINIS